MATTICRAAIISTVVFGLVACPKQHDPLEVAPDPMQPGLTYASMFFFTGLWRSTLEIAYVADIDGSPGDIAGQTTTIAEGSFNTCALGTDVVFSGWQHIDGGSSDNIFFEIPVEDRYSAIPYVYDCENRPINVLREEEKCDLGLSARNVVFSAAWTDLATDLSGRVSAKAIDSEAPVVDVSWGGSEDLFTVSGIYLTDIDQRHIHLKFSSIRISVGGETCSQCLRPYSYCPTASP